MQSPPINSIRKQDMNGKRIFLILSVQNQARIGSAMMSTDIICCYIAERPEDKMESINLFDVLGIDSEASVGEIKKAYRKLVFKYHPDYNPSKSALIKFEKISDAYSVLADPIKRDEYLHAQSNMVTDEPWSILNNYWEMIYKRGFH
jgi:preprotein translocase subunit Sec63